MKKIKYLRSALLIGILTVSISLFGKDRIIPYSEVPSQILTYIKKHFPNNEVVQSEVDYEGLTKKYDIILSDNIKLEFDGKNNIKGIDAKSELPNSVIPLAISKYVKSNYPNNFITEWDLNKRHQSVELDNGIEIEFTLKGEYLRIDD